jgi:hypothetical protein
MASREWKWFIVHVSGSGANGEIRGFVEEGEAQAAFASAAELVEFLSSRARSEAIHAFPAADAALGISCTCCA